MDQPLNIAHLMPPTAHGQTLEQYGRECFVIGIFNERAAVLIELDFLAREFDSKGRPNTARRVREAAAKIEARLRQDEPGDFRGPQ